MKNKKTILTTILYGLGLIVGIIVMIGCIFYGGFGIIEMIASGNIITQKIIMDILLIVFSEAIGAISTIPFVAIATALTISK